ncbi:MAG: zinc ribbon domain-containing protein [Spirochaetaceae bacterium]|jgi:putative FmdB family regulatory protein|nr:zinc ribbon domain-containing protein [Spirochaetaceae bacterium]
MPTYGYECKSCGHAFDVFQHMSDEPLKVCPECGKELRRLINGGTGVIFKGSGFYVTDKKGSSLSSKPQAKPDQAKADQTKPAPAECASCAKAEACPATQGTAENKAAG